MYVVKKLNHHNANFSPGLEPTALCTSRVIGEKIGDLIEKFARAFCGRVPKSVLARHYTDYSPEKLKLIYEKARLRIFRWSDPKPISVSSAESGTQPLFLSIQQLSGNLWEEGLLANSLLT